MASNDAFEEASIRTYEDLSGKYEIHKKIGKGSFGDVLLVTDVLTREKKAIKAIKITEIGADDNRPIDDLIEEAEIMKKLDHPNIVKFYDCFQYLDYLSIVCEYCEGGDLSQVLRNHIRNNTYISMDLTIEWYHKISLAVEYLHDQKIIHRDIKSENIFLKNNEIKLGDFGVARFYIKTLRVQSLTCLIGTPTYMSPEMYLQEQYNFKTDIWSLGCVFYEIHFLEQPFKGKTIEELKDNILKCELTLLKLNKNEIVDLLKRMLCKNKDDRLAIKDVLKYSLFKRFNGATKKTTINQEKKQSSKSPSRNNNEQNYKSIEPPPKNIPIKLTIENTSILQNWLKTYPHRYIIEEPNKIRIDLTEKAIDSISRNIQSYWKLPDEIKQNALKNLKNKIVPPVFTRINNYTDIIKKYKTLLVFVVVVSYWGRLSTWVVFPCENMAMVDDTGLDSSMLFVEPCFFFYYDGADEIAD